MNGFAKAINSIAAAANENSRAVPGDYIYDGLLHCGKCGTPKQCAVELFGRRQTVGCLCRCGAEALRREEQRFRDEEERQRIARLRTSGIQDSDLRACSFEHGDKTPVLMKAKHYADKWDDMFKENIGLLLWGNTGNGKTYAAAAIANALIDRGIPALVTSFPKILSAVTGLFAGERAEYIDSLANYKLLVIDDLGAERQSEFALEIVYSVIDARYKSGLPLIITTNLSVQELRGCTDMQYRRIYDRVLEMCVPLNVTGESRRKAAAENKRQKAIELFAG